MTRRRTPLARRAASTQFAAPVAAPCHDGTWALATSAEEGRCPTSFDFKVRVKDGKVTSAGFRPVMATGGISRLGVVTMPLAHGAQRVTATGLAAKDAAADRTAPQPLRSGAWFAKRA